MISIKRVRCWLPSFPALIFFFFLILLVNPVSAITIEDLAIDLTPQYSTNNTFPQTFGYFTYSDYFSEGIAFLNSGSTGWAAYLGSWEGGPDTCNVQVSPDDQYENYFRIDAEGPIGNDGRGGVLYIMETYFQLHSTSVLCYNLTNIAYDDVYLTFMQEDEETGFAISLTNTSGNYDFRDKIQVIDHGNGYEYPKVFGKTCISYHNLSTVFNTENLTNLIYLAVEFTTPGDARNFYLEDIYFYNVSVGLNTTYNDTEIDFDSVTDATRSYDDAIPGGISIFNSGFWIVFFLFFLILLVSTESVALASFVIGMAGFIFSYLASGDITQMVTSLVMLAFGITLLIARAF